MVAVMQYAKPLQFRRRGWCSMTKKYNPEPAIPQDELYDEEMSRNILCLVWTMKRGVLLILRLLFVSL